MGIGTLKLQRRAVFLDRDGVLNHVIVRAGKTHPPADASAMRFVSGAQEAVAKLKEANYICICVTNQPDVARGSRSLENVLCMNRLAQATLLLDDVYACVHDDADKCNCRKPKPGLLLSAAEKWGIRLSDSWMVGDRPSDVAAGQAAGCRTILIADVDQAAQVAHADHICPSLIYAVDYILRESL